MKAAIYKQYGPPEVLSISDAATPEPKPNEIQVSVKACSINASDLEFLTAKPNYIRLFGPLKPANEILGSDISGVVTAVGEQVTEFKVGDLVFGDTFDHWGGFAQTVCAPEKLWVKKPDNITHIEAACIPQSGVIAHEVLNYPNNPESVKSILIIGAGGGAGSFLVQQAKSKGLRITSVDRKSKTNFLKDLGVDRHLRFETENYLDLDEKFDLIVDFPGPNPLSSNKALLTETGSYCMVGGRTRRIFMTGLGGLITTKFSKQKTGILLHQQTQTLMTAMADAVSKGELRVCVDKVFSLEEIVEAFKYFQSGNYLGKVVISIG